MINEWPDESNSIQTITVDAVNIDRLRKQRDTLVKVANGETITPKVMKRVDGVIFLLDEMLDIAEGFKS